VPTSTGSGGRSRGRGRSPRRSAPASDDGSQHGGGDTNKHNIRASRGHDGHAANDRSAGEHEFGIAASDGDRSSHVAAKAARDVSVRFKDERATFGGAKDQWWPDFVSSSSAVLPSRCLGYSRAIWGRHSVVPHRNRSLRLGMAGRGSGDTIIAVCPILADAKRFVGVSTNCTVQNCMSVSVQDARASQYQARLIGSKSGSAVLFRIFS